MGYQAAGYYNLAPEFINFESVGMKALEGLARSMGMSVGDLQSQMQNYSRFITGLQGTANAPGGGGNDWFDQWTGKQDTMKDWIDAAGGEAKNIYEPADRLYDYWTQDSLKALEDATMGDRTAMLSAGDAAPSSRTFDQTNLTRFKQQAAGLMDANRRGSTEPWMQGVYAGYSNYLNQGNQRAQLAAQMMQGYFGQLMNPYNTILQANAGGYGGGLVREQSAPANMMGMSAGFGGGSGSEEVSKKNEQDAMMQTFKDYLSKGGVGTPDTNPTPGSTTTPNPGTTKTGNPNSYTAPPTKSSSTSWTPNQGQPQYSNTKTSTPYTDFGKKTSTNRVTG